MQTVKVDSRRRVLLGDVKPGQVFSRTTNADGSVLLVPVKEARKEQFPPGSLTKYFSGALGRERDERDAAIGSACAQGPQ